MDRNEMIRIARKASQKGWNFEQMKYGGDLYGHENYADDVWDYVVECKEIGTVAFDLKYSRD